MKNLLTTAAVLLALTATVHAQTPPLSRTQEYRIWSAEQMIDRLVVRLGKLNTVCNYAKNSTCKESVVSLYPQFKIIREVAAGGDDVEWAKVIDVVHKLEADTEPALNALDALK